MAWDDIISRGIWVIIKPSNFLFITLVISIFLRRYMHSKSNRRKIALLFFRTSLVGMFLVGFTNVSSWIMWPLEKSFQSYINEQNAAPYAGIIVLGGAEKMANSTVTKQATFNHASERLMATAKLAHDFPNLPIIHSTGSKDSVDGWSANDVAKEFFESIDISPNRIRFEGKSYNTHTNAVESKKLIKQGETGKWLLVTSAFHMPRAVGAFQQAGINIQPYPVDFKTTMKYNKFFRMNFAENLFRFDLAIHEYVGLIAYYLSGRSSAIFPTEQQEQP